MEGFSSMVAASLLAGLVCAAGPAAAAGDTATLSWTAPTVNADGSKLSDLLGFNVYRGTSPAAMMLAASVPANTNSFADANLTPSVWYWYVTAVNSLGVESAPSPTVSKAITNAAAGSTTGAANAGGGTNSAGGGNSSRGSTASTGASTSGSTSGGGTSSSSDDNGTSSVAAQSPYRIDSIDSMSRRTHCRPVGMVLCVR
jgi:hypothetical protein